jgi:hypothetical protein
MSVSTWAAARDTTHVASDMRPDPSAPPAGVTALRPRRRGMATARDRFAGLPSLRLVPPLPETTLWPDEPMESPRVEALPTAETTAGGDAAAEAPSRWPALARPITARRPMSPARPGAVRAPIRLTRRGRVVVVGLLVVLVAALVGVLASNVQAAAPSSPPRAVVVHPGDTLWSIAARVHPSGSLTDTMLTIERLNHMTDGTVYVGQQLLVPNS